jgi:prolyl-tRNA synthetase
VSLLGSQLAPEDLIGVPHRLVISERGLAAGTVEYKGRRDAEPGSVMLPSVPQFLKDRFAA